LESANGTGGKAIYQKTHDIQRKSEKDWRSKDMGDWERKDPDEEFAWRDRKATVVQTLLDKLMDDDGIEHDAFLKCIETMEKALWETLRGK
jgi:hypothetical protein